MTDDQTQQLRLIRLEQDALHARWTRLEDRLRRIESAPAGQEEPGPRAEEELTAMPATIVAAVPVPMAPPPSVLPLLLPVAATIPGAPAAAARSESLEMQIGTTWLVRAGIVLFLTGFAFFGNYLYHHIVPHLGPFAKVGLFYLGAGALTGLGAWLERGRQAESQEHLRNYARVVLAGGLAAVYYVTYAAHWNPHLRVLDNAFLAGGLLLGWAVFMAWLADRRDSELLASFAILLAYYTSAINEISSFTLVSNLFLSAAAVFLLRRHLWKIFPFASVFATYGSYGFWRYFHLYAHWRVAAGVATGGFWTEGTFLLLYWLFFTWAVFTAGERVLAGRSLAGFVTANNTALFLLTSWVLLEEYPGAFWKWSLAFGAVLLGLAETSRRLPRPLGAETEDAYLLQGVLLVTLGFINYFSGWQLSLVLAVQSVTLLALAQGRASRVLLGASGTAALLSFGWAMPARPETNWVAAFAEGTFLVFNAWRAQGFRAKKPEPSTPPDAHRPPAFSSLLALSPGYFSLLGLVVWFRLLSQQITAAAAFAPVMAGAAVLLTASIYVLRVEAIPLYAQGYLFAACYQWLAVYGRQTSPGAPPPIWNPLLLLAATLALGHWWQRWTTANTAGGIGPRRGVSAWNALFVVGLVYLWLRPAPVARDDFWVAETTSLSLVLLIYGALTRWRALALAGQILLLVGIVHFLHQWAHPWSGFGPEMWLTLAPLLGTLATLVIGRRSLAGGPSAAGEFAADAGIFYEFVALILFLLWGCRYFPAGTRFSWFCVGGGLAFALGCQYRVKRWMIWSAVAAGVALAFFWLVEGADERRNLFHLLGIACLAGAQQFGRRRLGDAAATLFPPRAQATLTTAATLCGWALLTARMGRWHDSAFSLAAGWSLYAVAAFGFGLVVRERVYRWLGLLILLATLGRIACVDIWQLDQLARALSLLLLGVVLLGLGFFYTRYGSKLRDIL